MAEPIDVAIHWPFVRRKLLLDERQHGAVLTALDTVAELQLDARGERVSLARQRFRERGLTSGQAGAVYNALVSLEARRVVSRQRGRGRIPDGWSLRGALSTWRGVAWEGGGRAVETAVGSCRCGTFRGVDARVPGQGRALRHLGPDFWLSAADHLLRPGLLPVDTRVYAAEGATTPRRPGETPVDARVYAAQVGDPVLSSYEDSRLRRPRDDDEPMAILRAVVEELSRGSLWGGPERELRALAGTLDTDQARALGRRLLDYRRGGQPVHAPTQLVVLARELARAPDIVAMGVYHPARDVEPGKGQVPGPVASRL